MHEAGVTTRVAIGAVVSLVMQCVCGFVKLGGLSPTERLLGICGAGFVLACLLVSDQYRRGRDGRIIRSMILLVLTIVTVAIACTTLTYFDITIDHTSHGGRHVFSVSAGREPSDVRFAGQALAGAASSLYRYMPDAGGGRSMNV